MTALQQAAPAADQALDRFHHANRRTMTTMQARYQMHQVHMAAARARVLTAAICANPAFDGAPPAGSWSIDLTTRKPGSARLTSTSAT
jgi:hypothetical protein